MDALTPVVKHAIESIIQTEKFGSSPNVLVKRGSQTGDGYTSKTHAITIAGNDKKLDLFVKYFPESSQNPLAIVFQGIYRREQRFYEEIYPIMLKFQQDRGLREIFNNVPKYYSNTTTGDIPPIILGNLKELGYSLRNVKEPISDIHIKLGLTAYARFHATSFALKDQNPETFASLCSGITDFFGEHFETLGLDTAFSSTIQGFSDRLDPITNNDIYNKCVDLHKSLTDFMHFLYLKSDEYSVLCHGDCWSNNFMYYVDIKTGIPTDIKLLDWQILRIHSPVVDLIYFFYSAARKDALDKFDFYMNMYYDTLADHIKNLGSNPAKIYPKEIFVTHIKAFAKFGLTMAFMANRTFLLAEDEVPNLIESADGRSPILPVRFKNENIFQERMIDVIKHFVEKEFL